MIKLPWWIFRPLERLVVAQREIRRRESARIADEQDRRQRAYFDALRERHAAGTCGGKAAGCCYVPCRCPVDCTQHRAHDRDGYPIVPTHLSSPEVGGKLT